MTTPSIVKEAITRGAFLRTTAATAAFTILPGRMRGGVRQLSANDKMNIAGIGIGGQGASNLANLSAELLGGSIYLVRGKAEPGTTIRIAGRETIAAPDGGFQIQVTASGAARELAVEAQDPQGNSSQYKVSLSARAGRRS